MDMAIIVGAAYFLLQGVVILLLGINIRSTNTMSRDVTELTTWAKQHEKQDDERHKNEREDRRDLWSNMNELKDEVKRRTG